MPLAALITVLFSLLIVAATGDYRCVSTGIVITGSRGILRKRRVKLDHLLPSYFCIPKHRLGQKIEGIGIGKMPLPGIALNGS